ESRVLPTLIICWRREGAFRERNSRGDSQKGTKTRRRGGTNEPHLSSASRKLPCAGVSFASLWEGEAPAEPRWVKCQPGSPGGSPSRRGGVASSRGIYHSLKASPGEHWPLLNSWSAPTG